MKEEPKEAMTNSNQELSRQERTTPVVEVVKSQSQKSSNPKKRGRKSAQKVAFGSSSSNVGVRKSATKKG